MRTRRRQPFATQVAALLAAAFWAVFAGAAPASTRAPEEAARAAAQQLQDASRALAAAKGARDRVKALSATVRGYEAGLEAMRDGLRQVTIREQALSRELAAREGEVSRLLGAPQSISRTPAPARLIHPSGPTGTLRGAMLLAEVTPALQSRVAALRSDLQAVTDLRVLQEDAAAKLAEGLQGAQAARTALSQAVADRRNLPRRFTEDPVQTAVLIAATETLEGFASGLTELGGDAPPAGLPDLSRRKGKLPLPAQGRLLRRAGEEDAAGVARPGIVLATRPRALVTTPVAATIRYRGPLLDYGQVSILEPQAGMLLVLAGLDVTYGEAGQVLPAGSPVGLMGGEDPPVGAVLSQAGEGAGADRSETLYIEVRQGKRPVDPLDWFTLDKE